MKITRATRRAPNTLRHSCSRSSSSTSSSSSCNRWKSLTVTGSFLRWWWLHHNLKITSKIDAITEDQEYYVLSTTRQLRPRTLYETTTTFHVFFFFFFALLNRNENWEHKINLKAWARAAMKFFFKIKRGFAND